MSDKTNLTINAVTASEYRFRPHPLRTLNLIDNDGSMTFDPLPDMTALEAARLGALFAMLTGGGGDWRSYLDQHGLSRHFKAAS